MSSTATDTTSSALPTELLTVRASLANEVVEVETQDGLTALAPMVRLDVISDTICVLQKLYDVAYEEAFPGRASELRESVRKNMANLQVGCERMAGERIVAVTFSPKGEMVLAFASNHQMVLRGLPDRQGNNPVFGTNDELDKTLIRPMDLVYQAVGLPPPADIPMLVGTAHDGG